MNDKEIVRVEVPLYIKEAKLSNSQRAVYWEWDGVAIKAKNKHLLSKFIGNKDAFILANKVGHPSHLKKEYYIGATYDGEVVARLYKDIHATDPVIIKAALMNGVLKRKLTEKQAEKVKFYLYDRSMATPIIDNEGAVGTPKYIKIRGQDIYSGNVREFVRGEIIRQIKDSFRPYVQLISPIGRGEYPLKIVLELHTPIKNINDRGKDPIGQRWDIDNHCFPYAKAFPDVLMEEGKIVDDDRLHISQPPHGVFCPVDTEEERKLVFILYQDNREIITNKYAKVFNRIQKSSSGEINL